MTTHATKIKNILIRELQPEPENMLTAYWGREMERDWLSISLRVPPLPAGIGNIEELRQEIYGLCVAHGHEWGIGWRSSLGEINLRLSIGITGDLLSRSAAIAEIQRLLID